MFDLFVPFTGIRLFVTLDSGSIMLLLGFENLATNFVYLRMQCQIMYTEGRSHFAVVKGRHARHPFLHNALVYCLLP